MTSFRIEGGTLIDRSDVRRFTFNGEALSGFGGDTVASALLANGKQLVGRSFKYHRPRGILTAGAAEPNALLTIGRDLRRDRRTAGRMSVLISGRPTVCLGRYWAPGSITRHSCGQPPFGKRSMSP